MTRINEDDPEKPFVVKRDTMQSFYDVMSEDKDQRLYYILGILYATTNIEALLSNNTNNENHSNNQNTPNTQNNNTMQTEPKPYIPTPQEIQDMIDSSYGKKGAILKVSHELSMFNNIETGYA